LDVFNYSCHSVLICHAELKGYLLAYLPGGETFWGETSRVRIDKWAKVHKSVLATEAVLWCMSTSVCVESQIVHCIANIQFKVEIGLSMRKNCMKRMPVNRHWRRTTFMFGSGFYPGSRFEFAES